MAPKYSPKHYTVYADQNLTTHKENLSAWLIRGLIVGVTLAIGFAFRHPIGEAVQQILG